MFWYIRTWSQSVVHCVRSTLFFPDLLLFSCLQMWYDLTCYVSLYSELDGSLRLYLSNDKLSFFSLTYAYVDSAWTRFSPQAFWIHKPNIVNTSLFLQYDCPPRKIPMPFSHHKTALEIKGRRSSVRFLNSYPNFYSATYGKRPKR